MNTKPILCVDFDGVIHSYSSGWQGASTIPDPPVPGALRWLSTATRFFTIVIYSSRSSMPLGVKAMREWLHSHAHRDPDLNAQAVRNLLEDVAFAREKPSAFLTIDDRAICFDGDWDALKPEQLLAFKPWNKR